MLSNDLIKLYLSKLVTFFVVICSLFSSVIIISCSKPSSELPPPCKINKDYIQTHASNAGCLVKNNDKLLVIKHRLTNKLGIPGGTNESGETAQCTAHRETWEETGHAVIVEKNLKEFSNGFRLYHCRLDPAIKAIKDHSSTEVIEVLWLSPNKIDKNNWRFPQQLQLIKELFDELPN
jgi:8-oxo-dGTP pyrophosphatase MutT (NUDIX family)